MNSTTHLHWMIYGAYGDMGARIIEYALSRQQRPVLAGRNATKLRTMAEKYGLEWRAFDAANAQGQLTNIALVLNIAGPFSATCEPLVKACLTVGAHYLDIANDLPSYQRVRSFDKHAQARGVTLIPGVGFGVMPTDMLSTYVAGKLPNTVTLHVAMLAQNARSSVGATRTMFEIISGGGWVRRNRKLVSARLGSHLKKVRFPEGERALVLAPLGDLETSYWSTDIPNITAYIGVDAQTAALMGIIYPLMRRLIRVPAIRRQMEGPSPVAIKDGLPTTVQSATTPSYSYAWANAVDSGGKQVQAWLQMGESLEFTAAASVMAVEQTLKTSLCGALSPTQAFGTDFVLAVPGVKRLDTF